MKVTIDRFEGEFAVVEMEDRTMANLPKIFVPEATEGDIIEIKYSGDEKSIKYKVEKQIQDIWK